MRAIAGWIELNSGVIAGAGPRLSQMLAAGSGAIAGTWEGVDVALAQAHCRYFVEDSYEAQPRHSADGNLIMVTDAALTNRAELALRLGIGTSDLYRMPDSELILAVYERWGKDGIKLLDGHFAFAAWHKRERCLVCAVDPFSFRPIYYARHQNRFGFATTLRGLFFLPWIARDLDTEVMRNFISSRRSAADATLYRDVRKVPAAHCISVHADKLAIERYWQPNSRTTLRLGTDREYQEVFDAEFERAVAAGLRPTGNIGVMVSGGLDSAAVTAKAGRLLAQQGRRLQAFHKMQSGDARTARLREHDESRYVRLMQQALPEIDFHFIPPSTSTPALSLEQLEEQFALDWAPARGFAYLPDDAVDEASISLPTVERMLWGLGGNYVVSLESFPSPFFAELAVKLNWVRLYRELHGHREFYGRPVKQVIRQAILNRLLREDKGATERAEVVRYLNPSLAPRAGWFGSAADSKRKKGLLCELSVRRHVAWIMDYFLPQHIGVSSAVVVPGAAGDHYSPYFDRRLNEFCLSVPVEQQIRNGRDRLMLRGAMRGLLPDEVAWRVTRGFPQPGTWSHVKLLQPLLPDALNAMEQSRLVHAYLDFPRLRRDLLTDFDGMLRTIGTARLRRLFNLAWFLRWLERQPIPT